MKQYIGHRFTLSFSVKYVLQNSQNLELKTPVLLKTYSIYTLESVSTLSEKKEKKVLKFLEWLVLPNTSSQLHLSTQKENQYTFTFIRY